MLSRIYVAPKSSDSREKINLKSWAGLRLSGKINKLTIIDSYLVDSTLPNDKIKSVAQALTNPVSETSSINQLPQVHFDFAIEIGFLPGVTDNVGHTTEETIADLLHLNKTAPLAVYTSKVFLISGKINYDGVQKISATLYNPLIERALIYKAEDLKKTRNLSLQAPRVSLNKQTPLIKVSLDTTEDELIKIGREGIQDPDGSRRGPLALDLASMQAIREHFKKLKRSPTDIELESLAQTWSEHCKHTIFANPIDDVADGLYKTYIKGATNLIRKQKGKKDFCVSVFSDNAGGIIFDEDYLVTHKVETHNSPSALDPFGGAITGIVGVNRDTIGFGLGAKPVANAYGFCFGEPTDTSPIFRDKNLTQKMFPPKRIMEGVVKGINAGGNCSGIPTMSGFIRFDDRYKGKPLVFAGTVGLIPRKIKGKPSHEKMARPGDYIVVVGGRVGADGIHGATFSSTVMDSSSPATAVQIGDPITQKKLSDAIVKEARDMGLYTSITDNGAGGISCSVAEMAKECNGAKVNLEKVPLKYPNLSPWQIWISESQERMTLSVPKKNWKKFEALMASRGVEAVVIGEFNNSGNMTVKWQGKTIMDLSLEFLHNGLPKIHLKTEKIIKENKEPKMPNGFDRTKILEKLLAVNNVGGFSFISEQYDHEVQASSVLKPLSGRGRINTDAQVFSPLLSSKTGVVLSTSTYPSYGDISTYDMASCAIDTVIRNTVACGGSLSHLAILDNFCWCSSTDKTRLYELLEALKACYTYAVGYGTPFISGKDSMWNDFKGYDEKGKPLKISVPPTLLISSIGVIRDISKTVSPEFKNTGDVIYLLGETRYEMGAGEFFKLLAKEEKTGALGHCVPKVDLKKNIKTYRVLEKAIQRNLVASAISLTSGGLGVGLAKASLGGMLGCDVSLKIIPGMAKTIDAKLFSESQGRILVSINPKNKAKFEKTMKGVSFAKIGKVSSDNKFIVTDGKNKLINTDISRLNKSYHGFSNSMK